MSKLISLTIALSGLGSTLMAQATPPVVNRPPAGQTQQTQAQLPAQPVAPMVGPAIRVLGAAAAVTTEPLVNPAQVRALPGGRVLVNDAVRRRVLLFDSTMALIKVVADSSSTLENAYGLRAGKLMSYRGDSSVLIDAGSYSMLVIDGQGNIVRVKAVPRTDHVSYYGGSGYGFPGLDAQGRIIYRTFDPGGQLIMAPGGGIISAPPPDSAPVLRLDIVSRKYDTVGMVRIQTRITQTISSTDGFISERTLTNPMPVQDDWAVTSDGAVAFLRHRDYSLHWLNPDGTRSASPPMPFEWQRLTDDHKKAFVDSMKTALEESRRRSMVRFDSINTACFNPGPAKPAVVPPAPPPVSAPGRAGGPAPVVQPCPPTPYPTATMFPTQNVLPYDKLPDYKPPFAANSMRGDEDGNLWIRVNQMRPVAGTYLYDIANRKGELVDRVQMPIQRTVIGFAPGNIVYTLARDATGAKLERVRWK